MKKHTLKESFRLSFIYIAVFATALAFSVSAATTISTNVATDGNLTVSGTAAVTGLTSLGQASSTRFSVFTTAYFGGTATTTIDSSGNLSGAGTLSVNGNSTFGDAATDVNLFTGKLHASTTALFTRGFTVYDTITVASSTATTSVTFTDTGINFDSNTFVIDPYSNRVGVASSSPAAALGVVGTTTTSGGAIIGAIGSPINQIRFGTCTYNPGAAVTTSGLSTNCTGATGVTPTDKVFVTPQQLELGLVFTAASSTANDVIQVTVFNATTTGGITPASRAWFWMAIK